MARALYLLFALVTYAIFLATFLYLIGFVGNLPGLPRTLDRGPDSDLLPALVVNVALIALFGFQHSIMARQGFKRAWTKVVPKVIERSTYVLYSSIVLIVLFVSWRPLPQLVWNFESPIGAALLWALFGFGWLVVLVSTFLINHFELFGLQQVYFHLRARKAVDPRFRTPFLYKLVRHPLYTGFFLAFWMTPTMTLGHFAFAVGMSVYMLVAIRYEERDLVHAFGKDYEDYRLQVGMITPRIGQG